MKLKSLLDSPSGLRYVFNALELKSSIARGIFLEKRMMTSPKEINDSYKELSYFISHCYSDEKRLIYIELVKNKLCELKDIRGTLLRLEEGATLDDIELFEIKLFSLLCLQIREINKDLLLSSIQIFDPQEVISLLDPDGHKIGSFYIYDSYSDQLRLLRNNIKREPQNSNFFDEANQIENEIRRRLSKELFYNLSAIKNSLLMLANLDILIAKASQIKSMELSIPTITEDEISYHDLFHPEVGNAILKEGRVFQKVDISFNNSSPTLITGANMGGKTVVLKTLALSQYLFQFGFGIPASKAQISPVEEIHFCIGDDQNSNKGLSSFSAEMFRIDKMIQSIRNRKKILCLIDEPARTTNPLEGTALVSSLINIIQKEKSKCVITTHYNIEEVHCNRLRVKGFINGVMDYSLVEDNESQVPREAINIARSLGIDEQWINEAEILVNQ